MAFYNDPIRVVEVYFDPKAVVGGQVGAYRARLEKNHGIHDAGKTKEDAIYFFLILAASRGLSGKKENYEVKEIAL